MNGTRGTDRRTDRRSWGEPADDDRRSMGERVRDQIGGGWRREGAARGRDIAPARGGVRGSAVGTDLTPSPRCSPMTTCTMYLYLGSSRFFSFSRTSSAISCGEGQGTSVRDR